MSPSSHIYTMYIYTHSILCLIQVSLRNQESSNPRDTEDALTEDTRNIHIEDSTDTKPRGNNDISIQKNGDTLVQKEESFPDRDRSNETSTSKQQGKVCR